MEKIIKILVERDKITYDEAKQKVEEFLNTASEFLDIAAFDAIEEALMEQLGLEPDYLIDLLGVCAGLLP